MKGLFLFTAIVVCLLLAIVGCSDRTTVPDTTTGATTEPSFTAIIEGTPTAIPNETQEGMPDITHETTPEPTTVTTVAPTAAPTKTPTATKTPESTPRPKNPTKLTAKQEREIKEDYLALCKVRYGYDDSFVLTTDDITDFLYIGTYDAGVAVIVMCKIDSFPQLEVNVDIEGFHFSFAHYGWSPQIYNNGNFTYLHDAYKAGILSVEDIRDIHWYYTHQ